MKSLLGQLSVCCLVFCFLSVSALGQNSAPDLIFHNGTILTIEIEEPEAEALAVTGDTIVAIGGNQEILTLQDTETRVIDLEGKTLMPGFVDAHSHLFNDAETRLGLSLEDAQRLALENGITTLGDLFVTSEFLEQMENFEQEGKLLVRTSLFLVYTDNCGNILGDWYKEHPATLDRGEMLRIGGVKIFADGGTCGLPAVSFEYPNTGGHGDLWFNQEELNNVVASVQAAGYQVPIHAQGDLAIEQAQDAIEFALAGKPNTFRHRIDHNAFIRSDLLPRYSEIGIVAAIFGDFPTCAEVNRGAFSSFFGTEPLSWLEDWRALLDANPALHVAWHSDAPFFTQNPIAHLYSYVTRKEVDEDGVTICEPPDWLAAHRITAQEALPMMTIEAAYALFRDEEVGSLKPGKFADLVILSDNPLTVDPEAIKDIEVLMTMVGGSVEYCAPGREVFCSDFSSNLALNKPATASSALPTNPPELAVDGSLETHWGSGDFPPQWIEIDLGAAFLIESIRLTVDQSPDGETRHQVWGKASEPTADYELLHEFSGFTVKVKSLSIRLPLLG